ncbi:MAG: hypothetical protein FRX49_00968 [Trebouxia sp. A1-2]|nr:MAG: hypothetical protein FRX49_00968 [Trebouxia sp. A1-2]
MGKLSWHVESPPPFAFVTPDQQIKPFGRTLGPKHAHLHPSNLRVDDIPGSRPKHHCFTTPPRLTNPLEPDYPLPHHNHPQPAAHVPKFIKDSLDNSDIPGTQASPRIRTQPYQQNFRLDCSDVDGAAPGWQPDWKRAAKARHASLRPATAPTHRHTERAVRPSNYVSDIERTSPWHQSNADAHLSKSSKLPLSNAEVLRVANGMADCHGLMDYRSLTNMLQSQGLHNLRPLTASSAGSGARKPPLARSSSSSGIAISSKEAELGAKHAQHAVQQKVPYFFSKGQVNMQQPYRWMPSKDDTTIHPAGPKGQFVRPWTAGQAATMPAQAKQLAELDPAAICADAARPEKAFFDDSRPYQRPVQAAASLDVSQRDSPAVRRQKGSLLEDMMTIKRL